MSATIGPLVALVSAAMTTPPSNTHPTIVVPVLVALGRGTPCACRATFRLWLVKSKPGIAAGKVQSGYDRNLSILSPSQSLTAGDNRGFEKQSSVKVP